MLIKEAKYIDSISLAMPGDIVLFRVSQVPVAFSHFIEATAKIKGAAYGHADTTHAAIIVDAPNSLSSVIERQIEYKRDPLIEEEKKPAEPWIAHVTEAIGEDKQKFNGYRVEPLSEYIKRNGGERAFEIFRPLSPVIRQKIANDASDDKKHRGTTWSGFQGAKVLITKIHAPNVKKKEPERATFCSRWVTDRINELSEEEYKLDINSTCLPSTLEDALYQNPNYDLYIYTGHRFPKIKNHMTDKFIYSGKNPLEYTKKLIANELDRLEALATHSSYKKMTKYNLLEERYNNAIRQIELYHLTHELDDFDAARILFKSVLPVLKIKTGRLKEPLSYRNVKFSLQKIGIFIRDLYTSEINAKFEHVVGIIPESSSTIINIEHVGSPGHVMQSICFATSRYLKHLTSLIMDEIRKSTILVNIFEKHYLGSRSTSSRSVFEYEKISQTGRFDLFLWNFIRDMQNDTFTAYPGKPVINEFIQFRIQMNINENLKNLVIKFKHAEQIQEILHAQEPEETRIEKVRAMLSTPKIKEELGRERGFWSWLFNLLGLGKSHGKHLMGFFHQKYIDFNYQRAHAAHMSSSEFKRVSVK